MLLIRNGTVTDPASGTTAVRDILIEDGKFSRIAPVIRDGDLPVPGSAGAHADNGISAPRTPSGSAAADLLPIVDASGLTVMPGFVDTHSHFRDPGWPEKETIETGAAAAAGGGYTTVIMMGNTRPPISTAAVLRDVLRRGQKTPIHVLSCACVTKDRAGKELADLGALHEAGAVCFTDDGSPIMDASLLEQALKTVKPWGTPVSLHEEDPAFVTNPGVNAGGAAAASLGLTGADREAEISMVRRDLSIAVRLHAPLCIQHISAAESVELVRQARKENPDIHAEATPHHFSLTEEAVIRKGTLARCNPPLRTERDRRAIVDALKDGTIDIIATDHAPHTRDEKAREFTKAPSGMIGLETAFSLGLKYLVQAGGLTLTQLVADLTINPAAFYHLNAGAIRIGAPADLCIADLNRSWTVGPDFASRSSNSPFIGETLPGVIRYTIADGKIVYRGGDRIHLQ